MEWDNSIKEKTPKDRRSWKESANGILAGRSQQKWKVGRTQPNERNCGNYSLRRSVGKLGLAEE
jgi:hypothetical protein